jgi:hypothetical protein
VILTLPYIINLSRTSNEYSDSTSFNLRSSAPAAAPGAMPAPAAPAPGAASEPAAGGGMTTSDALHDGIAGGEAGPSGGDSAEAVQPAPEMGGGAADTGRTEEGGVESSTDVAPEEALNLFRHFSAAYAWIEITGELPGFLEPYEAELLDDSFIWDMYFDVPRDIAVEFITEITGDDSDDVVVVTYNDDTSDYVVVMYTQG